MRAVAVSAVIQRKGHGAPGSSTREKEWMRQYALVVISCYLKEKETSFLLKEKEEVRCLK